MNTEKTKDSRAARRSPIGDFLKPTPALVFLCTTTLQNPRAPRGFYGRTAGQFSPPPIRPFQFPCPKFPCPTRPQTRTAASRPPRWASAVRGWGTPSGSFPLCVLSDLCGVPLRAPTIGAFPENTAEIGRNAEREGRMRALRVGCCPAALCSSYLGGLNSGFNRIETAKPESEVEGKKSVQQPYPTPPPRPKLTRPRPP